MLKKHNYIYFFIFGFPCQEILNPHFKVGFDRLICQGLDSYLDSTTVFLLSETECFYPDTFSLMFIIKRKQLSFVHSSTHKTENTFLLSKYRLKLIEMLLIPLIHFKFTGISSINMKKLSSYI